jgi:uncharacterized protein YbdZ (MbtH family)
MTPDPDAFDASRYLTKLKGIDYLEVKWRLLWLRTLHPDAVIETEMMVHDGQHAIFRASVAIPGGGAASGWGSEAYNDFRDYIEKAETKSLGRALAALGYGTQFTDDLALGESDDRGDAAPAPRQPARQPTRSTGSQKATKIHHNSNGGAPDDPVATWTRNLRNATTPAALDRVIRAMAEHGLDTDPRLAPLIADRAAALAAPV